MVGISTSPRRFSLLFFSTFSASTPTSSALLLEHFTDNASHAHSHPAQVELTCTRTFTCSLSLLCWSTRLSCSSRHFTTLARRSQGIS